MSVLDEVQVTVTRVSERASPWVVGIGSRIRVSGFVLEAGRVVTNAHNLRGDEVTVHLPSGRTERGRVVGVDPDGDLAVVAVDTDGAPAAGWGDGAAVSPGRAVFGVAALPEGRTRITVGLVSAVGRAFRGPGGRRIGGSI